MNSFKKCIQLSFRSGKNSNRKLDQYQHIVIIINWNAFSDMNNIGIAIALVIISVFYFVSNDL